MNENKIIKINLMSYFHAQISTNLYIKKNGLDSTGHMGHGSKCFIIFQSCRLSFATAKPKKFFSETMLCDATDGQRCEDEAVLGV